MIDDVYGNLESYNSTKKMLIVLILFDDVIADMEANEKSKPNVAELFIRGKNLNISLVFLLNADSQLGGSNNFLML